MTSTCKTCDACGQRLPDDIATDGVELGEKLLALDISQKQLADFLGISRPRVNVLLKGRTSNRDTHITTFMAVKVHRAIKQILLKRPQPKG
jgi:plasmid maintenance system antidote protein VapI